MEDFKLSIKKIRKVFIILTILVVVFAISAGVHILTSSSSFFSSANGLNGGSATAGFEFLAYLFCGIGLLLFIPLLIVAVLIVVAILWGVFGIIYAVKKSKYKKGTAKVVQVATISQNDNIKIEEKNDVENIIDNNKEV